MCVAGNPLFSLFQNPFYIRNNKNLLNEVSSAPPKRQRGLVIRYCARILKYVWNSHMLVWFAIILEVLIGVLVNSTETSPHGWLSLLVKLL
mmetsp:Transcript_12967/g.28244  ORF Transcript_12967/g.28244 Transcript_12967/m.28244 type:complete len:91 (+) Transcript_12967:15-287(+)